jgi:ABC-type branched-subunit amino acid transport system ATPase component
MNAIFETRGLTRTFGAVVAAKSINVSINQGEVVGVIGSNGAGKTTFINMATGYLAPSSGEILFKGQSILGRTPRENTRHGISRSFQVAQLFPQLTVMENMLIALVAAETSTPSFLKSLNNEERRSRAEASLASFGVSHYRNTIVSAVPQGARKLIDIAMALVSKPQMLLLDEPTSGVSSDEKFPLMDTVMAEVRKHRVTVLFVEHDMEIIARYVTRIIELFEGGRMNTALSIRGLNVDIGRTPILNNVDLTVPAGHMVGLIGRNGAGKTTLMRAIMRLLTAKSGEMTADGTDLIRVAPHDLARRGISYLPEDRRLIPALTVEENILLPAWANAIPGTPKRLEWIYGLMPEVEEFRNRRALQLSGGQQKLVALARALMPGNKLLLLDEPFEGVAPVLSRRLVEVIAGLRKEGLSVVLSESDAKHSADLVDLVFNIERGVVTQG